MQILSRLTFAASLLAIVVSGNAAPPRVSGNRPIAIDVPAPEADSTAAPNRDSGSLAALLPDDKPQAGGAAEGPKALTPATELKRAREQLLKCSSISANLVESVTVLEKGYKAEGRYLQRALKPNNWHMRMELVVKIGESQGALLEVCDGEVLWTRMEIDLGRKRNVKEGKDITITRRNVAEIMSAARKIGDPKIQDGLIASMGLGGLPGLIAGIEENMKFSSVKEETLRETPVLVVQGTWTDSYASKLRGGQQRQAASALLPAYVPDSVRLYFDRETGFPHRIEYRKKVPGRDVQRPMVTLDFLDVTLNQPINNSEFDYEPPAGTQPQELTRFFVDRLTPPDNRAQPGGPLK